jgi:hypothetical protein
MTSKEREFIETIMKMVKSEVASYKFQVETLLGYWQKHVREEQCDVLAAAQYLRGVPEPSVREILIAAGWLPPCEGRKTYEGLLDPRYYEDDFIGAVVEIEAGRRYRLILDPLPEKEEGE